MTGGSAVTPRAMTSATLSWLVMLLTLELVMGSARKGTQDSSRYVSNSPRPNRSATSFAKKTAQRAQPYTLSTQIWPLPKAAQQLQVDRKVRVSFSWHRTPAKRVSSIY